MGYINKKHIKRGITYIEVISSLFIITIIFTLVFPLMSKNKGSNIDVVTNKVISELRYAKSLAIAKDSNVYVVFLGKNKENPSIEIYSADISDIKVKEYVLPKGYRIITNYSDLDGDRIVFKPDGTLNHRATTIKVRNIVNNETYNVTLTIGFTRIMRVS